MSRILLFLCFCVSCLLLKAQNSIVISNRTNNVAYIGMDNPISGFIAGEKCKSVVLKTDNGKIETQEDNCGFIFKPKILGKAQIDIFKKSQGKEKLMSSWHFKIKRVPKPTVYLIKNSNLYDTINKENLKPCLGLGAGFQDMVICDVKISLLEFSMIIMRDGRGIYEHKNVGQFFDENIKTAFDSLLPNDKIIFCNIIAEYVNNIEALNPIEFTVR